MQSFPSSHSLRMPVQSFQSETKKQVTAAEAAKVPFGLGTLPLPSLDPRSSNSTCRFLTNNLWSDIKGLQAPDEPGDPNVPVQTYSGPTAAPSDCEGFANLVFKNAGTIGNTQTLILPANKIYMLSYAMAPSTVRLKSVTVYAAPPPQAQCHTDHTRFRFPISIKIRARTGPCRLLRLRRRMEPLL